ncbi:pentapeptide repeat-containing protein, partial [Candidatus Pseudothioglobus singularis]|nr:pentapeptide repeat-containing protein [Candidatus Pseudothioglobus singularis]
MFKFKLFNKFNSKKKIALALLILALLFILGNYNREVIKSYTSEVAKAPSIRVQLINIAKVAIPLKNLILMRNVDDKIALLKSSGSCVFCDLSNGNFKGSDLKGVDLRYAILIGANLSNTNLNGAILHHSNLSGANLDGTILTNANLAGANLSNTNLNGAILHHTNLVEANLDGVDLSHKDLTGTNLDGVDLS